MRILAFNGSMRKAGNTNRLIEVAIESTKEIIPSVEIKTLRLLDLKIDPCKADYSVCSKVPFICSNQKDDFQMVFDEMKGVDAILLGSPVYYMVPSRLVAFLERLADLAFFNEMRSRTYDNQHKGIPSPLLNKPVAFISVCYIDSPIPVLEYLHKFAAFMRMKPVNLGVFPYFGVAGRDDLAKDTYYQPIEKAKILGSLLAKAISEK